MELSRSTYFPLVYGSVISHATALMRTNTRPSVWNRGFHRSGLMFSFFSHAFLFFSLSTDKAGSFWGPAFRLEWHPRQTIRSFEHFISLSTFDFRILGISIGSYRNGVHPFGSNPRVQQADRTRGNRDRLFRLLWLFSRLIFESFEFVITPFFSPLVHDLFSLLPEGEHSLCRCPHHI